MEYLYCVLKQFWSEFCLLDDICNEINERLERKGKAKKKLPRTVEIVRFDGLIATINEVKSNGKTYEYARLIAVLTGDNALHSFEYEVKNLKTNTVSKRSEKREYIQLVNTSVEFYTAFDNLQKQYSITRSLCVYFTKKYKLYKDDKKFTEMFSKFLYEFEVEFEKRNVKKTDLQMILTAII